MYYSRMEGAYQMRQHRLVVTGPMRDRLYERFTGLYRASADVMVLKDRRYTERRRSQAPRPDERRGADRRRRLEEWVFPPEPV